MSPHPRPLSRMQERGGASQVRRAGGAADCRQGVSRKSLGKTGLVAERPIRADRVIRTRAREFRRDPTEAEGLLWQKLRGRQLAGLKFRRQHPVKGYVADFYCAAAKLIVEVDGPAHQEQEERDRDRTWVLESFGYRVIRFSNDAVHSDLTEVLRCIAEEAAMEPPNISHEGLPDR